MDKEAFELEREEFTKRNNELDFIASQNLCSEDVLDACSSIAQMKYAEGFSGKRYYAGCEVVDKIEARCEEELLKLFGATEEYNANVQPANGSSANIIAYRAILKPGDNVLACDVSDGSHITHAHSLSFIAEYHNVTTYGLNDEGYIDYEEMERLALETNPKLIIVGMSNYSREIDYKRCKEIADKVGSVLMTDIAHISGLVATGLHNSPVGYADIITSTTHKILRGPRSAFIIYKKDLDKAIKRATIPGCFGGPDEAKIQAKLICFKEAQTKQYKEYCEKVVKNAKVMVKVLNSMGIPVLTGGTDNHSFCINLTDFNMSGRELSNMLATAGIITNCNSVPNDKRGFFQTSGVRMGTPSITTRGLKEKDCSLIAEGIGKYIIAMSENDANKGLKVLDDLSNLIKQLVKSHPISKIYPKKHKRLFK